MRVIILGGTGLIGHRLSYWLAREQHEVLVLSRNSQAKKMPPNVQGVRWDGYSSFGWGHLLDADTVLINLAGHNPFHWRWTRAHKRRVLHSRLDTTQAVLEAVHAAPVKPALVIQASAVGFYGDRGEAALTEADAFGAGWRAEVCLEGEGLLKSTPIRTCILRIGAALSREGGFLPPMQTAARLLVPYLGDGKQWVPWVHIDDVAHVCSFLIATPANSGVYNVTAPQPVTNAGFMAALARAMGTSRLLPVPAWALRLGMGEQASVLLDSQKVLPDRLLKAGYRFKYPSIDLALDDLVRR